MKVFRRKQYLLLAVVILLLLCFLSNPFLRVKTFLFLSHEKLENALLSGNGVPPMMGVKDHDTWEGEHTMEEFLLFASGFGSETTYYGCYYSWDDVPLAFQNLDVPLTQTGHAYWKWQGEGDNWGATQKILDHWYYFKASF